MRLCWPCECLSGRRAGSGRPPTIATETEHWRRPRHPTPRWRRVERAIAADAALRAAEAFDPGEELERRARPGRQGGRIARSTAFFSIATAASRVAGLGREIVAAGYYGVSGPMSAFTIAFQVPNLVRALFADAALQPAFVPVFTELLEQEALPRGLPPRLDPAAAGDDGAGRDHRALRPPRAGDHAALRARLRGRDPRPHRHPLPGPLPDPDPARGQRRRRRHPQQLRPLRRLRDLAAVLEPDDHPRPGRRSSRCSTARTGSTPTRSGSSSAPWSSC